MLVVAVIFKMAKLSRIIDCFPLLEVSMVPSATLKVSPPGGDILGLFQVGASKPCV